MKQVNAVPVMPPSTRRWTGDEEQRVGRAILAAEMRAEEALREVPLAREVLYGGRRRAERTRAGRVTRLETAIVETWKASEREAGLRGVARRARAAWAEAEQMRWSLAMSGRRIAHGEARKLAGPFMDEADLVQEGYIGLLRAAKRFEPSRGIRFSTYARWWVRAQMTRAIDHTGRPIRLPGCAVEQTRNLRKAMKTFEDAGETWTVSQLAFEVGIDVKRAQFLLSHGRTISFDEPSEDGTRARPLETVLADDSSADPDEEAIRHEEMTRLLGGFQELLSERHRSVLRKRYGLDDDEYRTLSDVGVGMDLSRERVRQIEREALIRLREAGKIRSVA
jgi:RNA polymerase nonessential primary-like sigma factor